jgi:uncharacterized membrane protein required for colicin V production
LTTLFIDLAILGTIVFCAWRGFKSGLIRGVFGVISLVVSLLLANVAAITYSDEAKGMLMPFVSGIIDSTITEMVEDGLEYQHLAHDHVIDDVDFGTAYTVLRQIGLSEAAAVSLAEQALEADVAGGVNVFLSDLIADKLSSALSYVAVFGIAFLLVAIAFAVVGNLVGIVFALPGLKLVDMIAGAVLGLFKGVIIVYTIAVIVRYFGLVAQSTLERTIVLNYLVNNNPIANMLGI